MLVEQRLISLPLSAFAVYVCGRIIDPSVVDPMYEQPFYWYIFSHSKTHLLYFPSNGNLLLSVPLLNVYN